MRYIPLELENGSKDKSVIHDRM